MGNRSERIVETAVELAEQGGFEAVRLRDVAAHAQVALGTLYRRFRSKEAIHVAALEHESTRLEKRLTRRPVTGDTPFDRLINFFSRATQGMFRRPNLSKAVLRAVVCGEPEITEKASAFHERMTDLIAQAVVGPDKDDEVLVENARTIAYVMQQVWFAGLVGWMGDVHGQDAVMEQVTTTANLVIRGVHAPELETTS